MLDPEDREGAGARYEELRESLLRFFRWRGAFDPEDLADETLSRLARKIADGVRVDDPRRYVLGMARLILLEEVKERVRHERALTEWRREVAAGEAPDERRMACLERCLDSLPDDGRELILSYYSGERTSKIENRRRLAERLEVPIPSLRIRVHRMRERLERCISECAGGEA